MTTWRHYKYDDSSGGDAAGTIVNMERRRGVSGCGSGGSGGGCGSRAPTGAPTMFSVSGKNGSWRKKSSPANVNCLFRCVSSVLTLVRSTPFLASFTLSADGELEEGRNPLGYRPRAPKIGNLPK
nr:uncharacterized protein LOC123769527 [Procambarus clarkii]